ncbi:MAG: gamma-glutamyl-gamma-aminobutyrate hydrolase family protein [Patescibacteria group bacterium]|jgi:anthranilate/para-aminobenzoate synthase component II
MRQVIENYNTTERNIASVNVALIDNGADSLSEYVTLLTGYKVRNIMFQDIKNCDLNDCQLIILSDGHSLNASENIDEIELIRNTSIPVIGICYGFQVLCYAYGAKLVKLSQKREGLVKITAKARHSIFQNKNDYTVSEKHRFGVQEIPETLVCLASSIDGCEIIQVQGKQQFGFQFHPENISPQNEGMEIFNNLVRFILLNNTKHT